MATTATGAFCPASRGGRIATTRPSQFINNDTPNLTVSDLRFQRLRLLGIIGQRANLVASLAWGDLHHG